MTTTNTNPTPNRPAGLLPLGQVLATPGALAALSPWDMTRALWRHRRHDWGEVCPDDAEENRLSVERGFRVLSVYRSAAGGEKFWVITEADRSATTVLLPEEY